MYIKDIAIPKVKVTELRQNLPAYLARVKQGEEIEVMVFDALEPRRLSRRAKQALTEGSKSRSLACSDICLWELAMLAARGKIDARGDPADRLVAATALEYGVPLVTADAELRKLKDLKAVW